LFVLLKLWLHFCNLLQSKSLKRIFFSFRHMKNALTALAVVLAVAVYAQPTNPGAPSSNGQNTNPAVPVDGGLTALVAAGAAVGYRQYKKRKQA
jgi:hypothetical protein